MCIDISKGAGENIVSILVRGYPRRLSRVPCVTILRTSS